MKTTKKTFPGMLCAFLLFSMFSVSSCKKEQAANEQVATETGDQPKLKVDAGTYYTPVLLFNGGSGGYHSYRIPSVIRSKKGTLIAFAEGRVNSNEDYGNIDIVSRRLASGGTTWTALQAIVSSGTGTWGNPTAVVNQSDGKIWLFFSSNDATHSQSGAGGLTPITQWGQRRVWCCYSTYDQDGSAWSTPVDMTSTLLPSNYAWDAMGPGIGIQKLHGSDAGRLIIPAISRNIYSDDDGATWHYAPIPGGTSEGTIVEKLNGSLIRNDRAGGSGPLYRQFSEGAVLNWPNAFASDTELPDPHCQGSILRYNEPQPNRIFFLNSNSQTQRRWPTIRITYNESSSWQISRAIPQNGTGILGGYSSLVKTPDNMTGALIEYNENDNGADSHMSLQFHKFNLSWILNGATEPTGY